MALPQRRIPINDSVSHSVSQDVPRSKVFYFIMCPGVPVSQLVDAHAYESVAVSVMDYRSRINMRTSGTHWDTKICKPYLVGCP